jgi:hypothetical protein
VFDALAGKEPTFLKGDLIQGTGVTLTGTLTSRLVGTGNVTIAATGTGGGQVDTIVAGAGIDVDATDPINPEVALDSASIASLVLADTSVQPGNGVSVLANDAGYLTSSAIIDSITNGDTTHAPSRNAVFDSLALKADAVNSITATGGLDGDDASPGNNKKYGTDAVGVKGYDDIAVYNGAVAYLTSDQSIANAVSAFVAISFSAADQVGSVWWSAGAPTRLTVPSGVTKVRLYASCQWATQAAGIRRVRSFKNGGGTPGARAVGVSQPAVSGFPTDMHGGSPVIDVVAGDYFEMMVHQNSGVAVNATNATASSGTWMSIEAIT